MPVRLATAPPRRARLVQAWLRVVSGYHTAPQVVVGWFVGTAMARAWHWAGTACVLPAVHAGHPSLAGGRAVVGLHATQPVGPAARAACLPWPGPGVTQPHRPAGALLWTTWAAVAAFACASLAKLLRSMRAPPKLQAS